MGIGSCIVMKARAHCLIEGLHFLVLNIVVTLCKDRILIIFSFTSGLTMSAVLPFQI